MITLCEQIYPRQFAALETIIQAVENNNLDQAKALVRDAQESLPAIAAHPERLQATLFLDALDSILNRNNEISNLYLLGDAGQQIRMFNFMAQQFPVVRLSQAHANHVFLTHIQADTPFTLVDIGMGTGQQVGNLIESLHAQCKLPSRIALIGIEPSADSLEKARERFAELSDKYTVDIDFTPIQKTAEMLEQADWECIQTMNKATRGPLFLNASFALHHTQPHEFRLDFFERLKALQPTAFVIIEPYADFTTGSLHERFKNAWHHYGLTFLAIDTIDATDEEKSDVKRVFFGRELPDVLGAGQRVEQYETSEMWLDKLQQAGFTPHSVEQLPTEAFNSLVKIVAADNYLGFNVKGHPIVGVICVS